MPEQPQWPKLDPLTGKLICRMCWDQIHWRHDYEGRVVSACDGVCYCVHRSEGPALRRPKRERQEPAEGLRAVNPDFQEKPRAGRRDPA